ncbi:MAG: hypothetical protein EOO01_15895 [Chitinophagaceae bacterium]|nr:MAG: hypothetical protein EOO01_15895 [Chitinophagaceae bacterium]
MTDSFILELVYNDEKKVFDAEFHKPSRFTHKMVVNIGGALVNFEPDEERHYRAILPTDGSAPVPDAGLVKAVAEKLYELFQF